MNDPVRDIIDRLKGAKWIAYFVVLALVIIGVADLTQSLRDIHGFYRDVTAPLREQRLSNDALVDSARETSQQLAEFTLVRQRYKPQVDFENWDESTRAMIQYSQETQTLYARDFAGKIAHLRDEFLKRGLRDQNLDRFFEHPANSIGFRILAAALAKLAEDLASNSAA